jgi:hypothetical protein
MPTASDVVVANVSAGDLTLPDGVIIPASGEVAVAADAWAKVKDVAVVMGWEIDSKLVVTLPGNGDALPSGPMKGGRKS